jgi:diguanylate cyclase (GGDEF)-like protein
MDFGDADRQHNLKLNLFIGAAGFLFLFGFGINAWLSQQVGMSTVLLLTAAFGLFALFVMWLTEEPRYGQIGQSLASVFVFVYLLISGGAEGTGPLWCYPLVAIIAFLQGPRRGFWIVTGLTGLSVILLFVPGLPFEVADYPESFRLRFVFSFVALGIMVLIYEHVRGQSQVSYRVLSDELDRASRTDDLTGLANRREMRERLDAEFAIYSRYGHAFSVVMLDLDHFKAINDRYGHSQGDRMLAAVGHCLRQNVREHDRVARWGGEEFLILLGQTRLPQSVQVAEKLRLALAEIQLDPPLVDERVTASLGVQSIEGAKDVEDLLGQADARLYEAKHHGRNRVVG